MTLICYIGVIIFAWIIPGLTYVGSFLMMNISFGLMTSLKVIFGFPILLILGVLSFRKVMRNLEILLNKQVITSQPA